VFALPLVDPCMTRRLSSPGGPSMPSWGHRPGAADAECSNRGSGGGRAQQLGTAFPRDPHRNLHALSIRTICRPHPPAVGW